MLDSRGHCHPNGYGVQLELSLVFQPVSLSFNTSFTPFCLISNPETRILLVNDAAVSAASCTFTTAATTVTIGL